MKIISSLEKCFLDGDFDAIPELTQASMLRNERYSFCIAFTMSGEFNVKGVRCAVKGNCAANLETFRVGHVPVEMAVAKTNCDDNYLRYTPGLYPDLLTPYTGERVPLCPDYIQSMWVTITPDSQTMAGDYEIEVTLTDSEGTLATGLLPLRIIDAELPPQRLALSQFLHCDCLAQYYNVPVFEDRHFELIESFLEMSVYYGIDTALTPIFTPPLDTTVGGERLTTQLIVVNVNDGKYSFDFSLLDRWVDICERVGIYRYEMSYLFSQWGAEHAPKVMACVDGEYKRIFGWETDACGDEYATFLRQVLPALIKHMNGRGIGPDRMIFHVSDEPVGKHLDNYRRAKAIVAPLLDGYEMYDSLSDIAFYQESVVSRPIPAINYVEPFLEAGVKDLWVYYCVAQNIDVSNRFISMPSARNRVIGTQFYKYNIGGFLHWGLNFYNTQESTRPVNPYRETDCDYFGPAGDAFSVYPGADGLPLASLRLVVFYDALQDLRAFELCEKLYSREFVMSLIEERGPITFKNYPKDAAYLLELREKINAAIAAKINCNA